MKQLTDLEKQELETKIKDEQKRQQNLREANPDLPETFERTSVGTRFTLSPFWKYGFLVAILCLFAFSVFLFFKAQDSDSKKAFNLNLMIVLMLLFNHIAYYFTTKGWKSWLMKTVAWVWIGLVFVYMYVSWVA